MKKKLIRGNPFNTLSSSAPQVCPLSLFAFRTHVKTSDVILQLIGVPYVVENNVVKQTPNMRLKQVYFT